ncbi:riboflavin synthase alpha subunit [Mesorhizobium soli]|nr:riboflavin synthase alpha subunit [Mesorhizobium soli]
MTVTEVAGTCVTFEAMSATLDRTNLRRFKSGNFVNIERSAKMNGEVGGHLMAGHVATTAEVIDLSVRDEGAFIRFRVPAAMNASRSADPIWQIRLACR